MKLRRASSPQWLPLALSHLDDVLVDHAHCEKKAASNALSVLQAYPSVPGLALRMARLAREETAHLVSVLAVLSQRGLTLSADRGDPYAQALQQLVRSSADGRRTDRLLVAGIIEARSHERLALLAAGLVDREPQLHRLYQRLAHSEAGHARLFLSLARQAGDATEVDARAEALLAHEAQILEKLPLRPAIH